VDLRSDGCCRPAREGQAALGSCTHGLQKNLSLHAGMVAPVSDAARRLHWGYRMGSHLWMQPEIPWEYQVQGEGVSLGVPLWKG
jgi:hypothetical protein